MNHEADQVLAGVRHRGVLTARELATALGISQPSVSRLIARLGAGRVVRIAGGRSSRYGLRRQLPGLGSVWPLYRIGPHARVLHLGDLYALDGGFWYLSQDDPWSSLRGHEFPYGIYPGLPWFLQDLRPRGFLGRCFARRYAADWGVSTDPRRWSDDDVLAALLRAGPDLPGDIVVGDEMLAAVQSRMIAPVTGILDIEREQAYVALADTTLAGQWPGSSAAGEQPKFTATIRDAEGAVRHVIVKFSGTLDQPANQRWADLLRAEHMANTVLSEAGVPCARTVVVEAGGRCFLESIRFDRLAVHGRRGLVSLEALDAAYVGSIETPWKDAAKRLQTDAWMSSEDAQQLTCLWWFGTLIGNTDMHYGNVSLFLEPAAPLALAPTYDMVPMRYRPDIEGHLPDAPLEPMLPPPQARDAWSQAYALAKAFWTRISQHASVSPTFRAIAEKNLQVLQALPRL